MEHLLDNVPHPQDHLFCWGQEKAQDFFLKGLRLNRLSHSWLLVGPQGVGKRTLAYQIIRLIFSRAPDFKYLDQARHTSLFSRIAQRTHGDLLILETQKAEEVRLLESFLKKTPAEGGWRIALLPDVDELNAQGTNALLKSLEDPPPKTLILLTAQSQGKVLPTVRSRCQLLKLEPLNEQAMGQALQTLGLVNHPPQALFPWAQGCLGLAWQLLQDDTLEKVIALRQFLNDFHPTTLKKKVAMLPSHLPDSLFWIERVVTAWLGPILIKGSCGVPLTPAEQDVLRMHPLAIWWHIWDKVATSFHKSRELCLHPLQALGCILEAIDLKAGKSS